MAHAHSKANLPQRPRQPIRQCCLSADPQPGRNTSKHVGQSQPLSQRLDRILHGNPESRNAARRVLHQRPRRAHRALRLHRFLLQYSPQALRSRLPNSSPIRSPNPLPKISYKTVQKSVASQKARKQDYEIQRVQQTLRQGIRLNRHSRASGQPDTRRAEKNDLPFPSESETFSTKGSNYTVKKTTERIRSLTHRQSESPEKQLQNTTEYGTEEYESITPIDNGRTSIEAELGRRASLNLGLESSIENLDAILRRTTSVTATRRRALARGLVAVSGDGPQSGDGGVIGWRADVFTNKSREKLNL